MNTEEKELDFWANLQKTADALFPHIIPNEFSKEYNYDVNFSNNQEKVYYPNITTEFDKHTSIVCSISEDVAIYVDCRDVLKLTCEDKNIQMPYHIVYVPDKFYYDMLRLDNSYTYKLITMILYRGHYVKEEYLWRIINKLKYSPKLISDLCDILAKQQELSSNFLCQIAHLLSYETVSLLIQEDNIDAETLSAVMYIRKNHQSYFSFDRNQSVSPLEQSFL